MKLFNGDSKKLLDGFMESSSINCLTLEANEITEIAPGAFKFLPNLFYLNLARNFIPTSNLFSFDSHAKLESLILDENLGKGTLEIKSHFPNLQYLYFRKNGIVNLTREIGEKLPNLRQLYLSDNVIEEIDVLPKLTHLHLERNLMKKFNATKTKNLEFLQLDGNKIKVICNTYCHGFSLSLNGATNLQYLSLSANDINDIEADSFDDTINLLNLNLSNNKLQHIRKGTFHSLKKLLNLSISQNYLTTLPDFSTLQNLRELNLNCNKLETIPGGEFRNLAYLKTLSLSGNLLKTIEIESFGNLMSLENLDLSQNKLQQLPINWLTGVEELETLNLRGNCFANFASLSLGYMESLKVIFLQNNPMRYVNTRYMSNFPKNVAIYLENEDHEKCSDLKANETIVKNQFVQSGKIPFVEKIN